RTKRRATLARRASEFTQSLENTLQMALEVGHNGLFLQRPQFMQWDKHVMSDSRVLRRKLPQALIACLLCSSLAYGQTLLVEKGEPRAEIVVAADPPRTTLLAAKELQTYLARISGAILPIVSDASDGRSQVYVGASQHTQRLGLS